MTFNIPVSGLEKGVCKSRRCRNFPLLIDSFCAPFEQQQQGLDTLVSDLEISQCGDYPIQGVVKTSSTPVMGQIPQHLHEVPAGMPCLPQDWIHTSSS